MLTSSMNSLSEPLLLVKEMFLNLCQTGNFPYFLILENGCISNIFQGLFLFILLSATLSINIFDSL